MVVSDGVKWVGGLLLRWGNPSEAAGPVYTGNRRQNRHPFSCAQLPDAVTDRLAIHRETSLHLSSRSFSWGLTNRLTQGNSLIIII